MRADRTLAIFTPTAREGDAGSCAAAEVNAADSHAAHDSPCEVSIIVPTINEAENLPALVRRIDAAMAGIAYEVLVIDDGSQDGTVGICCELGRTHPVKLHVRQEPLNGLSGAVLYGFSRGRGDILAVMDADLQHPPEALPALIAPLSAGEADFVIGSRWAEGARIAAEWGQSRRLNSAIARLFVLPLPTGRARDPLSGFFALRRRILDRATDLQPIGYKIGLELLCRCGAPAVLDVPVEFGARAHGSSKLSLRQRIEFIRQIGRLYAFRLRSACSCRGPPETGMRVTQTE